MGTSSKSIGIKLQNQLRSIRNLPYAYVSILLCIKALYLNTYRLRPHFLAIVAGLILLQLKNRPLRKRNLDWRISYKIKNSSRSWYLFTNSSTI